MKYLLKLQYITHNTALVVLPRKRTGTRIGILDRKRQNEQIKVIEMTSSGERNVNDNKELSPGNTAEISGREGHCDDIY